MPKKTVINFNAQTKSQDTFVVDRHQNATNTIGELFTKGDFLTALDKVILTEKKGDTSSKGTKKTSE